MTEVEQAKKWLSDADAIIVTAGNGFAQEEGLDILSEENFDNNFGEIAEKYDVHTIGDALDKKFDSWGEQWAFWSELINQYTFNYVPSENVGNLKKLLDDKQYFIATSTLRVILKIVALIQIKSLMCLEIGQLCNVLAVSIMVKRAILK